MLTKSQYEISFSSKGRLLEDAALAPAFDELVVEFFDLDFFDVLSVGLGGVDGRGSSSGAMAGEFCLVGLLGFRASFDLDGDFLEEDDLPFVVGPRSDGGASSVSVVGSGALDGMSDLFSSAFFCFLADDEDGWADFDCERFLDDGGVDGAGSSSSSMVSATPFGRFGSLASISSSTGSLVSDLRFFGVVAFGVVG